MKKHETLLVSTILNGTYRGRRFLQMVGMVGLFWFGSGLTRRSRKSFSRRDGSGTTKEECDRSGERQDR